MRLPLNGISIGSADFTQLARVFNTHRPRYRRHVHAEKGRIYAWRVRATVRKSYWAI